MDDPFPFLTVAGISLEALSTLFLGLFAVGSANLARLRNWLTPFPSKVLLYPLTIALMFDINGTRLSNKRGLIRISRWFRTLDGLYGSTYTGRDALFEYAPAALAGGLIGVIGGILQPPLGPYYLWGILIALLLGYVVSIAIVPVIVVAVHLLIYVIAYVEGDGATSDQTRNVWKGMAYGFAVLSFGFALSLAGAMAGR